MRIRTIVTFLFAALLQAAYLQAPASAGSPAPDPLLAEVAGVRLWISSGDLGYEPIPGLDRYAIEDKMRQLCQQALERAGLVEKATAAPTLSVTVDHAWAEDQREKVAVMVSVQLTIPAVPQLPGVTHVSDDRKRSLDIWEDQTLELVGSELAERTILEALQAALKNLVDARQAAAR